jgi:hypothetical protein
MLFIRMVLEATRPAAKSRAQEKAIWMMARIRVKRPRRKLV